MSGPVVSLLPVRNGEGEILEHLASVERFADFVIALDDGSTDRTRTILESHPLVRTVLSNPRRPDYRGWDDSANRNRLLAAAIDAKASWVMSLDADELIAADDATALRSFLTDGDADPQAAYLFRVFRMIDDLDHFDVANLWVGRLFAPQPHHRFPSDRLHFPTIPTTIAREHWKRTTIRLQHRASITREAREARFAKYRQADPRNEWQQSYDNLLDEPGPLHLWRDRHPALPVLAHSAMPDSVPLNPDEVALSVVVIAQNDEGSIARSITAVVTDTFSEELEVIVVTSGTDRTATIVRESFPSVTVVELDHPVLPGEARNVGLRLARGRYVSFPGSHIELLPGSLERRLDAHRDGWPMVTGTTLNGTLTCSGWASYFLDNHTLLPGRPSFEFKTAPPRCSYRKDILLELGGFPEDVRTAEDTVVNEELFDRGYGALRSPEVKSLHYSPCTGPGVLVSHHFARGRGMGRILAARSRQSGMPSGRAITRHVVRSLPGRLRSIHRSVALWGDGLRRAYWCSLPLIIAGATANWLGTCYELTRQTVRRKRFNP